MDTPTTTQTTGPQTSGPVERAHASRFKWEIAVAVLTAVFTGLGALSGLNPVAQNIMVGAAAVVGVYAGVAYIRARIAKRRRH